MYDTKIYIHTYTRARRSDCAYTRDVVRRVPKAGCQGRTRIEPRGERGQRPGIVLVAVRKLAGGQRGDREYTRGEYERRRSRCPPEPGNRLRVYRFLYTAARGAGEPADPVSAARRDAAPGSRRRRPARDRLPRTRGVRLYPFFSPRHVRLDRSRIDV